MCVGSRCFPLFFYERTLLYSFVPFSFIFWMFGVRFHSFGYWNNIINTQSEWKIYLKSCCSMVLTKQLSHEILVNKTLKYGCYFGDRHREQHFQTLSLSLFHSLSHKSSLFLSFSVCFYTSSQLCASWIQIISLLLSECSSFSFSLLVFLMLLRHLCYWALNVSQCSFMYFDDMRNDVTMDPSHHL